MKRSPGTDSARKNRPILRRPLIAISACVGAVFAALAATPAQAYHDSSPCAYMQIIAVRGTDAAAGSGGDGNLWTSGGDGPVLDRLLSGNGGFEAESVPERIVSLNYPAQGGINYASSTDTGITRLVNAINSMMSNCAYKPQVLLLGHSQGADVILRALASGRLSMTALLQIKAVAVFGDPRYEPGQPIDDPSSGAGYGFFARNYDDRAFLNAYKDEYGNQKIRSDCFTGDTWCQNGRASNSDAIHNSYLEGGAERASVYAWMKDRWAW